MFGDFTVALSAFSITVPGQHDHRHRHRGRADDPVLHRLGEPRETIDIEVAVGAGGALTVTLAAQQSDPEHDDAGRPGLPAVRACRLGSSIDLEVATLEIAEKAGDLDRHAHRLAHPGHRRDRLARDRAARAVDRLGRARLAAGRLDRPAQPRGDRLLRLPRRAAAGSASDPTRTGRWIGFDADVNLVEGVTLGGSVRGLQVNLDTGAVSFSGVSVDFEIPGVLSFSGEIDHANLASQAELTRGRRPAVELPLPGAGVRAAASTSSSRRRATWRSTRSSSSPRYRSRTQPAAGEPLRRASSSRSTPNCRSGSHCSPTSRCTGCPACSRATCGRTSAAPPGGTGTSTRRPPTAPRIPTAPPTCRATAARRTTPRPTSFKWLNPVPGAFALGAGAVIGTQDDGFTASASIAFVLILPGPVIMLIGKANILSPRISGPAEEANFEAMATYDGNAGTFDLVIEAQYSIPVVLDVQATGELYVDRSAVLVPGDRQAAARAAGQAPASRPVRVRLLLRRQRHRAGGRLLGRIPELVVVRAAERLDQRVPGGDGRDPVVAAAARRRRRAARRSAAERVRHRAGYHRRRADRGDRPVTRGGCTGRCRSSSTCPGRCPTSAARSRCRGAATARRRRRRWPCPPSTRRSSTTAPATATNCSPTAPVSRSTPSARRTPSSTTRSRTGHQESSTAKPRGYWAAKYPGVDLAQDPTVVAARPRSRHARLRGAGPAGQPLRAELRPPDRGPGRIRQPGDTRRPNVVTVTPPPSLGADDMSNINLQHRRCSGASSTPWCRSRSTSTTTAADAAAWQLVAATPQSAKRVDQLQAPLPLAGSWVAPDPVKNDPGRRHRAQGDALHRAARRGLHPSWGGAGGTFGTSLHRPGPAVHRRRRRPAGGHRRRPRPGSARPALRSPPQASTVTITFAAPVVLTGLTGVWWRAASPVRRAPGLAAAGSR